MADNKVHYDLVDVHVASLAFEAGQAVFGAPKALPGSISMDLKAQGNTVKLRADGMDFYRANTNSGYEGDLNLAIVPDWFRQEYLGETMAEEDKVLVENAESECKPFALLYGFKGDASRRRHVLYNVLAGRPGIKGENKDNEKDPDTESLPISAAPLADGTVKASTTADTPQTVYDGWTAAVWVKSD